MPMSLLSSGLRKVIWLREENLVDAFVLQGCLTLESFGSYSNLRSNSGKLPLKPSTFF